MKRNGRRACERVFRSGFHSGFRERSHEGRQVRHVRALMTWRPWDTLERTIVGGERQEANCVLMVLHAESLAPMWGKFANVDGGA